MPRYHRLFIDGTLAEGAERWSTSIAFTSTGVTPDPAGLSAWADAVMTAFAGSTATYIALKGLVSNAGTIEGIRAYSYPAVGAPADVAGASSGSAVSGAGTPTFPPQCSLVFSLLTGIPGASYRGRMYWPHCSGTLEEDQHSAMVSQTFVTNVGLALASWGELNSGDVGQPAVISTTKGLVTPVTQVSIGDVVDTQRRRRDTLIENRLTAPVA